MCKKENTISFLDDMEKCTVVRCHYVINWLIFVTFCFSALTIKGSNYWPLKPIDISAASNREGWGIFLFCQNLLKFYDFLALFTQFSYLCPLIAQMMAVGEKQLKSKHVKTLKILWQKLGRL